MNDEKLFNFNNSQTFFEMDCYISYVKHWFADRNLDMDENKKDATKKDMSLSEYIDQYKEDDTTKPLFLTIEKFMDEIFPNKELMEKYLTETQYEHYLDYINKEYL